MNACFCRLVQQLGVLASAQPQRRRLGHRPLCLHQSLGQTSRQTRRCSRVALAVAASPPLLCWLAALAAPAAGAAPVERQLRGPAAGSGACRRSMNCRYQTGTLGVGAWVDARRVDGINRRAAAAPAAHQSRRGSATLKISVFSYFS